MKWCLVSQAENFCKIVFFYWQCYGLVLNKNSGKVVFVCFLLFTLDLSFGKWENWFYCLSSLMALSVTFPKSSCYGPFSSFLFFLSDRSKPSVSEEFPKIWWLSFVNLFYYWSLFFIVVCITFNGKPILPCQTGSSKKARMCCLNAH